MAWAPRCALLPLGSLRGPEGLTTWEYIAFAEACEKRYHSGEKEEDEEEEARFLFEEALARENEEDRQQQLHEHVIQEEIENWEEELGYCSS